MKLIQFTEPFNGNEMTQMKRMAFAKHMTAPIYVRTYQVTPTPTPLRPEPKTVTKYSLCRELLPSEIDEQMKLKKNKRNLLNFLREFPDEQITPRAKFTFENK